MNRAIFRHHGLLRHVDPLRFAEDHFAILLPLPDRLGVNAWSQLDALTGSGEHWEMLNPSSFAKPSAALEQLARDMNVDRTQDPMTLLRGISAEIFSRFGYSQKITRVDSPIDDALQAGSGVERRRNARPKES